MRVRIAIWTPDPRFPLILSADSIESSWIEREVRAALEKEESRKQTVLFPIRLDDSVMDCDKAWAVDIRRTRQIGDFTSGKTTTPIRSLSIGSCATSSRRLDPDAGAVGPTDRDAEAGATSCIDRPILGRLYVVSGHGH
ncbi:MAG TPA: TIR domain-containing protein [Blastocatellia bacterium]|nr:TIR domain-containing protein [Blastocatellia bacterium]